MRIAQISPLTEAVPPKLYGGTERVISWLTEELVALGHDVTLFASGDSYTSAKLEAIWPRALRLDGSVRDPDGAAYDDAGAGAPAGRRVRFSAFPSRLLSVLAVLAPDDAVPDHACMAGSTLPELQPVFNTFPSLPVISISNAQRRPVPQAGWVRTIYHGLPADLLTPAAGKAELSRIPRAHLAGESASIAPSGSPSAAALPIKIAAKIDKVDRDYFEEQIRPLIEPAVRRIHRRDQRPREIRIFERRHRAARADRLARAVRLGDDRGDGLRHAGDRVQSRLRAGGHRRRCDRLYRGGRDKRGGAVSQLAELSREGVRQRFEERFTARRMAKDYLEVYRELAAQTSPRLRLATG